MTPSSPTTTSTLLRPLSAPPVRNETREVVRTERASGATDAPAAPFAERLRAQTEPSAPEQVEASDDQAAETPSSRLAEPDVEDVQTSGGVEQEPSEKPVDDAAEASDPVVLDIDIAKPVPGPIVAVDAVHASALPVSTPTATRPEPELPTSETRQPTTTTALNDARLPESQSVKEPTRTRPLSAEQPPQRSGLGAEQQQIDQDSQKKIDDGDLAVARQDRTDRVSRETAPDSSSTREVSGASVVDREQVRTEAARSDVRHDVRAPSAVSTAAERGTTDPDTASDERHTHDRDRSREQEQPAEAQPARIEERPGSTASSAPVRSDQQGEVHAQPTDPQHNTTPSVPDSHAAPKIAESSAVQRGVSPTLPRSEGAPVSMEAQVTRGVGAILTQRGGSVTLKLAPSSLGTVKVSMRVDRGVVSIDLEATTENAHRALSKELGALKSSFEQRGVQVERAQVHLAPAPTPGPAQADQPQHRTADQNDHRDEQAREDSRDDQHRSRDGGRDGEDRNFARFAQDASEWGEESMALGLSAEA